MGNERKRERIRAWLQMKGIDSPDDSYIDFVGRVMRGFLLKFLAFTLPYLVLGFLFAERIPWAVPVLAFAYILSGWLLFRARTHRG